MRTASTRRPFGRRAAATFTSAVAAVAACAAMTAPAAGAQSVSFTTMGAQPCQQATAADLDRVISDIHEFTNRARAAAGAPPVARLDTLDQIAQNWSSQMAAADRMYHNPNIRGQVMETYPGRWSQYGENVLQNWCGVSGEALVNQWMNSIPHRVNLLNPTHTHLGVGAEVASSGKLYSTQNFVRLR